MRALLCLVVAVSLQIGVNYANDYSDGIRGTDKNRVGPPRLVGSGRARPRAVLTAALVFFGIAAVAGLAIVWLTQQWWLLAVGAVCIAAAWFYTGGKRPYGYSAFGELAVVHLLRHRRPSPARCSCRCGTVNFEAWLGGVAAGLFAAAVLLVNNLRDRAARRGRRQAHPVGADRHDGVPCALRRPDAGAVRAARRSSGSSTRRGLRFFALLAAVPAILIVTMSKTPREYRPALMLTLLTALVYGLGLAAAIAF